MVCASRAGPRAARVMSVSPSTGSKNPSSIDCVTAVVTALPTISEEFGGDSLFGVTSAAYTLANMVALVAAGELVDRRGAAFPSLPRTGTFVFGSTCDK